MISADDAYHAGMRTLQDRFDFEQPRRLRVNATSFIQLDDPLLEQFAAAQLVARVRATQILPNCPRYIHRMQLIETSPYAARRLSAAGAGMEALRGVRRRAATRRTRRALHQPRRIDS